MKKIFTLLIKQDYHSGSIAGARPDSEVGACGRGGSNALFASDDQVRDDGALVRQRAGVVRRDFCRGPRIYRGRR
mgnify:CR=1 FL=1